MKRHLLAFTAILLVSMLSQAQEGAGGEQGEAGKVSDEYRLQKNDSISMTMFQEAGMSRSGLIGKSGSISFTLIGSVDVVDLTVPQLEQKLTELYKKDYFVDPKISVIITGYATKNVTVSGAVVNPGGVPYPDEGTISLAQAVAASGGITAMGDTNRITIVRKKGGSSVTTMNKAGTLELLPGDTALVHMLPLEDQVAKTAMIAGEVNRGGDIVIPASGKIDILSAIAKAGGLSRVANKKEATLRRLTPQGQYTVETINMKDVKSGKAPMVFIREGDILMIKESIF
jgi:protein involved in polysaccharide export with SLBB domain